MLLFLLSVMIFIIGFTFPTTIHFKFITKCDKYYYKVLQNKVSMHVLACFMLHVPLHIKRVVYVGGVSLWVSSVCSDKIHKPIMGLIIATGVALLIAGEIQY